MNPINIKHKIMNSQTEILNVNVEKSVELVSSKTLEFVEKIANSTTETVIDFLNKRAVKIPTRNQSNTLYFYDNMLLHRTNGVDAYKTEQNLKAAADSFLAPRYVRYFELGKDDYLTISEIKASSAELINDTEPDNEAKVKLKNEIIRLYKQGFINKEILANKNTLLYSKQDKNFIIPDWTELTIVSPGEKNDYINAFGRIFL